MNGQELRDEGTAAVIAADKAIHRDISDLIRSAILDLADAGQEFTADDVRDRLPDDAIPHSHNLIPAHFGAQAHAGRIEAVGICRTTRTSRRASRNLIWKGAQP